MSESHWAEYHRRWSRLTPPLRPNKEVSDSLGRILAGHLDRVLLLGVTPELADIGSEVVGVDRSDTMIAHIWPGDTLHRRAVKGEWLALDFPQGHFSAVVGDGSLNTLPYPACHRSLYGQLSKVLRPGGRLAMRVFMAPDRAEPIAVVREQATTGAIRSFHAFKWRLAMAVVAEAGDPNIRVATILEAFDLMFPDRTELADATGWTAEVIATIDVYRGSPEVYSFPNEAELRAAVPESLTNLRLISCGSYELAERCPIVAMELAG